MTADRRWTGILGDAVRAGIEAAARTASRRTFRRTGRPAGGSTGQDAVVEIGYAPRDDGRADPGEVVWTWVAYEDNPHRGKDRPVLVLGRDGRLLVALQLSSQDHDLDAADEARHGRVWMDIGAGSWDSQGRPSEVRLDRVLRIDPDRVRRVGGRLDRARFDEVADAVRHRHRDLR